MSSVNIVQNAIDPNVRIFDSFYGFDTVVPTNEYDVVNSYFESVFGSNDAAANFSVTLFRVAQAYNIPVLTLLDELSRVDEVTLNVTLCYYLNGIRSNSTLLGVNSIVVPNKNVARNVLA